MDYINSLPQPFMARMYGNGGEWPVESIDVETGLMRLDICGLPQMAHIDDFSAFIDESGKEHQAETFYSDYEHEKV